MKIKNVFEDAVADGVVNRDRIELLFNGLDSPGGLDLRRTEACRFIFIAGKHAELQRAEEITKEAFDKLGAPNGQTT